MIGISSPSFSLLGFEEVFEEVRKEFDLWEIVGELEHDLPKIEEGILYGMESYGMKFQVHSPIADLNIGSPAERLRKHSLDEILDLIDICDRLSIEMLTVHPGVAIAYGEDIKPKVREATKESLGIIDQKIRGTKLRVALENMPPASWSIGYDLDELLSMIDGTGIGICFDVGHAHIARSTRSFLLGKERIINVHLHSNNGALDQHLSLDEGNVDLKSVVSTISRTYRGNYIIESRDLAEGVKSKKVLTDWLR